MDILVFGKPKSGKTTLEAIVQANSSMSVTTFSDIDALAEAYSTQLRQQIIVVDAPTLVCYKRSQVRRFSRFLESEELSKYEEAIKYLTELPNVTIIKNDESLDAFRYKVKAFIERKF